MTTPPHPGRDEFAEGVVSTLVAVRHLYAQLDLLNATLAEALLEEPEPFRFIGGTPLSPGRRGDRLARSVRDAYHLLLEPGTAGEIADAGDEDEGADEEGDPIGSSADRAGRLTRPRGPALLESSGLYLAVGVVLHDPSRPALPPHVHWGVLTRWGIGPEGRAPRDGRVELAKHMVVRALRALDPAEPFDPARRVRTNARAKKVSGRMGEATVSFHLAAPAGMVPLVELDSTESVERLAARIKGEFRAAGDRTPHAGRGG